jgi:hypothetical protein
MMTGEERMAQRRQMVACIPEQEIAAYRAARDAFVAASERADKAFMRWFRKREQGEPTNGAAATRASNEANYRSADMQNAESPIWRMDVDPAWVDEMDGVDAGRD